ncbi:MAG: hypothetical protein LBU83_13015 [Bacteroidales bacterium]|jgi:hypothetical protein|nr:hypothetical protein [Bacteroidales bacterium]
MKFIKFILTTIFILCCFTGFSQAKKKANKDTQDFRYDIECAGTGAQGFYLVNVWTYSKKPAVAFEQSKKNAVHGVLFKGFGSNSIAGCTSQRPIAANPTVEQEQADFFKKFFSNGGDYMKYVTNSGPINQKTLKVGKEYKVGVVVSVAKEQLRKDLEAAGIIKGLSSGF